jgi:uncharacterized protein YjiS (DUF1127 family)
MDPEGGIVFYGDEIMASVTLHNARLAIPTSLLAVLPADLPKLTVFSVVAKGVYDNTLGVLATALKDMRLRSTLSALDDHILDDMGLARGEIDIYVANRHHDEPRPSFYQLLNLARIRRRSINELAQLSDRMLYDIGITRGEIESVVDTLIAQQVLEAKQAA